MTNDTRLNRLDANRLRIHNPYSIDALLFVNEQVPVEAAAANELLDLLNLCQTVERFAAAAADSFSQPPTIK